VTSPKKAMASQQAKQKRSKDASQAKRSATVPAESRELRRKNPTGTRRATNREGIKGAPRRRGLRIRSSNFVNSEVRGAVLRFARWLRQHYDFPIRVVAYLYPSERIITRDGDLASASFFGPFDRSVEPYIRLPTGDYEAQKLKRGRDHALAAILCSLAHEVVHYQQWVTTGEMHERGVPRKAAAIVDAYAMSVDHP
jgi:hypothetical protein